MEGLETVATVGAEMSVILEAVTLVPRVLCSTKRGLSSLTVADSMDQVGVTNCREEEHFGGTIVQTPLVTRLLLPELPEHYIAGLLAG